MAQSHGEEASQASASADLYRSGAMTPLLARSLWECNGVERDAFRQHRGTSVVPATGWWTSCSKAQRWTACSRAPDYMPQSGLKPATVPCALTPLCDARPRSTVGVIGVFGAMAPPGLRRRCRPDGAGHGLMLQAPEAFNVHMVATSEPAGRRLRSHCCACRLWCSAASAI